MCNAIRRMSALCIVFFVVPMLALAVVGTWEYSFEEPTNPNWEEDWDVIAGDFKLEDGSLWQTDPSADDNNAFRALARTEWVLTDGIVEAKMMHEGAGMNDALVFYRMTDDDNGYASRLQLDNYITIGKITAGRHAHIRFVSTPVEANTWYVVRVELLGDNITVFVDDNEFFAVQDGTSPSGRVGFGMARSSGGARLAWIRVTGEGVKPLAVNPRGKTATTWATLKSAR